LEEEVMSMLDHKNDIFNMKDNRVIIVWK